MIYCDIIFNTEKSDLYFQKIFNNFLIKNEKAIFFLDYFKFNFLFTKQNSLFSLYIYLGEKTLYIYEDTCIDKVFNKLKKKIKKIYKRQNYIFKCYFL